jgi:hypothetical protein
VAAGYFLGTGTGAVGAFGVAFAGATVGGGAAPLDALVPSTVPTAPVATIATASAPATVLRVRWVMSNITVNQLLDFTLGGCLQESEIT